MAQVIWNNLLSIKGNGASEKEMRFFSGINYCAIAVNSSNVGIEQIA